MKRTAPILLAAALLLTAACQNTIRYEYDSTDGQITILSQMNSAEELHSVILSMSYPDRVESLPGATVRCSVNGEVVEAEEEKVEGTRTRTYTRYWFDAAIHSGDQVRIEAVKGSLNASATVTVPLPGEVSIQDTLTYTRHYESTSFFDDEPITWDVRELQVKLGLKDIPKQDSYFVLRVMKVFNSRHVFLDDEGQRTRPDSLSVDVNDYYWSEHDPILDDGYFSSGEEGEGLMDFLLATNSMHCFSDQRFIDGEASVKVFLRADDYPVTDATYAEVDIYLVAELLSVDRSFYNYLRALNNMEAYGYDVSMIIEPTMLPSNVQGGFGMVSAGAQAQTSLFLKHVRVEGGNGYYYWGY